ncbi:MAG: LysR family transcriptional regulator [Pseudomonadales bacterium]
MRTFIVVAHHGSFNRAAEELARTQPAITLVIKQLEEYIGVKLLERTTRRVIPTAEGENFLPIAERLVRDFDAAIYDLKAVAERRRGHVSMAILPSVATSLLPPVISAFSLKYPGIDIHLQDDNSRGVQQRIERNEVDFGIGSIWQPNSDLEFTPLLTDTYEMVCHKDHPLAQESGPIHWQQLETEIFLDTGISQMLEIRKHIGTPKFKFSNVVTLFAMLEAGLGITALPSLAVPLHNQNLVTRPLIEPIQTREICLITRKGWSHSPAAEAMLEMVLDGIQKQPQTDEGL